MVSTAASDLSNTFNQQSLMPMFQLSLIVFSGLTRLVNAKYLVKTTHKHRMIINSCLMLSGFILITLACFNDSNQLAFYVALISSLLLGVSSALGESTILGFCQYLPDKQMVGAFSSGTGFAGIFGAGFILSMKFMGMSNAQIFLSIIPSALVYYLCFYKLNSSINKLPSILRTTHGTRKSSHEYQLQDFLLTQNQNSVQHSIDRQQHDIMLNKTLNTHEFKKILSKVGYFIINLMLVYFLEYTILTSFCDKISRQMLAEHNDKQIGQPVNSPNNDNYLYVNGYAIMAFSYQIGVFISRSSLSLIKIQKVHLITTLQFVNFVVMLLVSLGGWRLLGESYLVLIFIMIWVGLMGGASYVNVMYWILQSGNTSNDNTTISEMSDNENQGDTMNGLAENEKELALTICTAANDIGILSASLLSLALNFVY
eukprot:403347950